MDITKMDAGQLRDALFDKMAEEQENYQSWLTTLPPDKILDHAAEFTIREDILVEMEVVELPTEQAAALLASPTPLADLYREWSSVETHHMEDIRDVIENCTEELAKRGRERSSLLDGLKRPAQPGPDRGTPPKHSGPEL